MALTLLVFNLRGDLTTVSPWAVGALALILVFGVAHHILRMAVQALRRGILNQHVLLEVGAFAGIAGGVIGLIRPSPTYPTGKFFAVSVMVATYHIFSEWLSLIVKTRSSPRRSTSSASSDPARRDRGAEKRGATRPMSQVGVGSSSSALA